MPLPEYSDDSHLEEDVDYDDNDDGDGEGCRYLSILMTPTRKRMLTMMTMMTGMARNQMLSPTSIQQCKFSKTYV